MNSQEKIKSQGSIVEYDGLKWVKMPSGYYFVVRKNFDGQKNLHRYIWVKYYGKIPDGYQVHHKDKNKENNDISNLELLTNNEHAKRHSYKDDTERYLKQLEHLNKIRPKEVYQWSKEQDIEKREKHRAALKLAMSLIEKAERECKYCGKKFMANQFGVHSFCSNKCKSAWRRKSGVDNETRICICCGKQFLVNRHSRTETCDRHCSNVIRAKTLKARKDGVC
jgi:hypothetical protein